jgi:hypothetical protein
MAHLLAQPSCATIAGEPDKGSGVTANRQIITRSIATVAWHWFGILGATAQRSEPQQSGHAFDSVASQGRNRDRLMKDGALQDTDK